MTKNFISKHEGISKEDFDGHVLVTKLLNYFSVEYIRPD